MAKTSSKGRTRLELDGDWGLYDFSTFGREYAQSYALFYVVMGQVGQGFRDFDGDRLIGTFAAYPWRGGYSAVNFYQSISVSSSAA